MYIFGLKLKYASWSGRSPMDGRRREAVLDNVAPVVKDGYPFRQVQEFLNEITRLFPKKDESMPSNAVILRLRRLLAGSPIAEAAGIGLESLAYLREPLSMHERNKLLAAVDLSNFSVFFEPFISSYL